MAITKATLAQETNGKVEYVYPKTTADIVELNSEESVRDKFDNIDNMIKEANIRIDNIATGIEYGSIGTKNDTELFDIRIQNFNVVPNTVEYRSAGEAIRGQFQALVDMINDLKEEVKNIKKLL
jgi:hypothetical protein